MIQKVRSLPFHGSILPSTGLILIRPLELECVAEILHAVAGLLPCIPGPFHPGIYREPPQSQHVTEDTNIPAELSLRSSRCVSPHQHCRSVLSNHNRHCTGRSISHPVVAHLERIWPSPHLHLRLRHRHCCSCRCRCRSIMGRDSCGTRICRNRHFGGDGHRSSRGCGYVFHA